MEKLLIDYLFSFLSNERAEVIKKVIKYRTRFLTVVLEDIYQSQNASAVLRTCDCFGIQDVHIIENTNLFDINPRVVRGANKWIDLHHHNSNICNSISAIKQLKHEGYRIVATSPSANGADIENIDIDKGKMALVFGNEHSGISNIISENADDFLKIPMFGFTESFNLSVSAAIVLQHLTFRLRQNNIAFYLSEFERDELLLRWLKKAVKGSNYLIKDFFDKNVMG